MQCCPLSYYISVRCALLEPVRSAAHSSIAAGRTVKPKKKKKKMPTSRTKAETPRIGPGLKRARLLQCKASFRQPHLASLVACPDVFRAAPPAVRCAGEAVGERGRSRPYVLSRLGSTQMAGGSSVISAHFPVRSVEARQDLSSPRVLSAWQPCTLLARPPPVCWSGT